MTIEFLITSFIVVLLPGTGVIYTLAVGLGRGFKPSVAAATGCTLGIVPAAIASIVGLAAVLHTSAVAFQILKYAGVAYLLYMAWSILRDDSTFTVDKKADATSYGKIALDAFLLNILNPKLSLFFLAFLPQFVNPSAVGSTAQLVFLASVFMAMTFAVFVVYGACASMARQYILSSPRVLLWIRRSFAGAFGMLGLKLALDDR